MHLGLPAHLFSSLRARRHDFRLLCGTPAAAHRGGACTKVGLALKHVPALDSYPTLRRNPPLSREQVLFFKDFTGVPSASQGAPLARGWVWVGR